MSDRDQILADLAAGTITPAQAAEMLDKIERPPRGTLYCKVSPKGAISVYGLQRMPVTLYAEQWERLLDFADQVRAFAAEHADELKRKQRPAM